VYQDFKNIYKSTTDKKVGKVALRKDHSFSHESEFRFVVRTKNHHLAIAGIDSQPLNLKNLSVQVIPALVRVRTNQHLKPKPN
jgi:hypothetical protein